MNNIETMEFSTANLERLAFYFKNLDTFNKTGYRHH